MLANFQYSKPWLIWIQLDWQFYPV